MNLPYRAGKAIKKSQSDRLLEKIPVKSIKVFVLSINQKWFNPDMLTRNNGDSYLEPPLNYQTSDKCMQTCYDIVKAFSTIPKPYDIDFPLYDDVRISDKKLNELLNNFWLNSNVTSKSHISVNYLKEQSASQKAINEFSSITFFPPDIIKQRIEKIMGFGFGKLTLKMRTYIRRRTKNKTEYYISFLPFAIIERLEYEKIDSIIQQLYVGTEIEVIASKWLTSYSAKFRIIQFIVADVFAKVFFNEMGIVQLGSEIGSQCVPIFSNQRAKYIVPKEAIEILYTTNISVNFNQTTQELVNKNPANIKSNNDFKGTNILECSEKLSEIFLELYHTEEIVARQLAKKHGKSVFSDKSYQKAMGRLERGYTFEDIVEKIKNEPHSNYITSVFLDYAIDTGIAVPITFLNNNSVSRAYRHGEDVIFSDLEAKLLAFMLNIFTTYSNMPDGVKAVTLEKLLSTFIRIGLVYNIFEKYDYDKIHEQTRDYLRIVYNIHGSIVKKYNSGNKYGQYHVSLTDDNKSEWVKDIMISKRLLEARLCKDRYVFVVPENEKENLQNYFENTNQGIKAERIASTFAYLYQQNHLNTEKLTLLNATLGYEQIIPALLAEVEIANTAYKNDIRIKIQKCIKNNDLGEIKELRKVQFFTAINSGKWKATHFLGEYAKEIIKQIEEKLKADKQNDKYLNWREFWNEKNANCNVEIDQHVKTAFSHLIIYLFQYDLIFNLLEYSIISRMKITMESTININDKNSATHMDTDEANLFTVISADIEFLKKFDMQTNTYQTSELIDKVNAHLKQNKYPDTFLEYLLSHLDNVATWIVTTQKLASGYVNNHGKIEIPIYYENIAIIEIFDINNLENIMRIIERIVKKRQKRITTLNVELYYQKINNGCAILARGGNTDTALFNTITEINGEIETYNKRYQIVLFLKLEKIFNPSRYESCMSSVNIMPILDIYNKLREFMLKRELEFVLLYKNIFELSRSCRPKIRNFKKEEITPDDGEFYTKFNILSSKQGEEMQRKTKKITFAIICARENELNGCRSKIEEKFNLTCCDKIDPKANNRRIISGEFLSDKITININLTQCDQGNSGAAIAYSALAHFKPDYIFFCGIAGGIDHKINIGDVIIPFEILDICLKKETNLKCQLRGTSYKIPSDYIGIIQQFIAQQQYDFNMQAGIAVSDNTVYATDKSEMIEAVRNFNDKVSCIEMESAGMFDADYTLNLTQSGVFTIRGISDKANSAKDDSMHEVAIQNASTVLVDLLEFLIKYHCNKKEVKYK